VEETRQIITTAWRKHASLHKRDRSADGGGSFDFAQERPKNGTAASFFKNDRRIIVWVHAMISLSLLSLPAVVGECLRS
jgi:hypothetical protein